MNINQNKFQNSIYFMRLALKQAQKSIGNTKDNPSVGCIITKGNNVISAGSTSINGRPHAEQNAIKFSKSSIKNSQLYVTLEPCSHFGMTAPCVNSIISKKVNKVFFSIHDPDKRSFNKSSKKLIKNGILVSNGILKKEVNLFYRSYLKNKKDNLPFVTCKLAISKDFYTVSKKKRWITNKFSRARGNLMRSYHDCLITSSDTIINDNPDMTCRIDGLEKRSPTRIILDKNLKIPINSKIFNNISLIPVIIFYNKIDHKKIKKLKNLKVKLYKISLDNNKKLDLKICLIKIKTLGFSRIFLESGIKLISNFLAMNLVDDFKLFISNKNIGAFGEGNFKKNYNLFLKKKVSSDEKINLFGDKLKTYKLK